MSDTDPHPSGASSSEATDSLFDENYYASNLGSPYERSDKWLNMFASVAERIHVELEPETVLDVGCAWGFLVEGLRDRGVDASGSDISEFAISKVGGSAVGHCVVKSIAEPLDGRYDLVTSIEMIEHMSAEEGRNALANMASVTDRILLSTTPFDYDELTHFNVQPPEYWAALMADLGFYRDLDYDASYLTSWAGLFVRANPSKRQLTTRYERSEWRYRVEALALRRELLKYAGDGKANVDAVELANEQRDVAVAQRETMTKRAAEAEAKLRTVRDAAIGSEASKGVLEARVIELQEHLAVCLTQQAEWSDLDIAQDYRAGQEARAQLQETQTELNAVKASRSWRLIWNALAPYRRLRGRR